MRLHNLNFRNLDPKIASKIHAHRIEHGHDNLTQTLECIIKQWDEQRDYVEEHDEVLTMYNKEENKMSKRNTQIDDDQVGLSEECCDGRHKDCNDEICECRCHEP